MSLLRSPPFHISLLIPLACTLIFVTVCHSAAVSPMPEEFVGHWNVTEHSIQDGENVTTVYQAVCSLFVCVYYSWDDNPIQASVWVILNTTSTNESAGITCATPWQPTDEDTVEEAAYTPSLYCNRYRMSGATIELVGFDLPSSVVPEEFVIRPGQSLLTYTPTERQPVYPEGYHGAKWHFENWTQMDDNGEMFTLPSLFSELLCTSYFCTYFEYTNASKLEARVTSFDTVIEMNSGQYEGSFGELWNVGTANESYHTRSVYRVQPGEYLNVAFNLQGNFPFVNRDPPTNVDSLSDPSDTLLSYSYESPYPYMSAIEGTWELHVSDYYVNETGILVSSEPRLVYMTCAMGLCAWWEPGSFAEMYQDIIVQNDTSCQVYIDISPPEHRYPTLFCSLLRRDGNSLQAAFIETGSIADVPNNFEPANGKTLATGTLLYGPVIDQTIVPTPEPTPEGSQAFSANPSFGWIVGLLVIHYVMTVF